MNINQIRTHMLWAFEKGQRQRTFALSTTSVDRKKARTLKKEFDQVLASLAPPNALHPLDWSIAEAITNSEPIDEMIRGLIDDPTHDNAVCLIRGAIEAYLKG